MKKELRLISPRGFCFGVKNALEVVAEAFVTHPNKKIFVYNEIVHNQTIIKDLETKGVNFTQDANSVPPEAVIIFSAHGVSPQVRQYFKTQGNPIMDATCPKVKQVHNAIIKAAQANYHIIYIGSPHHDEGRGVIAEAPTQVSIVETASDIEHIKKGYEKYLILTQTTLNMFKVRELHQQIKKVIPQVEFPLQNELCPATTERQLAIEQAAQECEAIIVIGSQNSSNSQKLKEIAKEICGKAYLIDSCQELDLKWLEGLNKIGLTAGASAPEYLITDTIEVLEKDFGFMENS